MITVKHFDKNGKPIPDIKKVTVYIDKVDGLEAAIHQSYLNMLKSQEEKAKALKC